MSSISLQYVYDSANTGWVTVDAATDPTAITMATSVFALVYGRAAPIDALDPGNKTFASAAKIGTALPITGPNPDDPNGLVTIAAAYALNAALTSLVAGRMIDETAATLTATANAAYRVGSIGYLYNGAAFIRSQSGSAANLAAQSASAAQLIQECGEWAINHTPVANTQATITRAAGAAGVRHVCKSITVTLIGLAASAEATVLVNLRDGVTGAGTILWSARLLVMGLTGSQAGITLGSLNIVGSAATAMTLEFAAAGGANTFETVSLTGVDAA